MNGWVYKPLRQSTPEHTDSLTILIAGCGGTGARVLGPLVKLVSPDTSIFLFDADTVEQRNLLRQHFVPEDVGRNKAEVLAERYELPNLNISARPTMLTADIVRGLFLNGSQRFVILGCTDSLTFRSSMVEVINQALTRQLREIRHNSLMLIDAGNESTTGQVVLEGFWPGYVADLTNKVDYGMSAMGLVPAPGTVNASEAWTLENLRACLSSHRDCSSTFQPIGERQCVPLHLTGMSTHFPDLASGTVVDNTPACGMRLDTQTVMVNQLAATWMICLLANLLNGVMTSTVGVTFSTSGMTSPLGIQTPKVSPYIGGSGSRYITC